MQRAALGPPFLLGRSSSGSGAGVKKPHAGRDVTDDYAKRIARARLPLPALRQGQALRRLSHAAARLRGLRARLRLHRRRRRPGRVRHHDRGRDRGHGGADHRGQISTTLLGACRALAAADARGDAMAAAGDPVAVDRAAIPPQGRRRPSRRARAGMNEAAPRRSLGFGIFTLLMVALFVGLGVWQLQRRVEKHALIDALTERLALPPGSLPSASDWNTLTPARDEFRRVSFPAVYQSAPDAMVYSSGSAV